MVKMSDLPDDVQSAINGAPFRHFYTWRAVYKTDSVTTLVRIVVDPTITGLNETLAKGINMLASIPDVIIHFRSFPFSWNTDLSKLYNRLFLDEKEIHGAARLELTDAMRVSIAAQACLPILNLGVDTYGGWTEVIVYPGEFRVQREEIDEDGVVHVTLVGACGTCPVSTMTLKAGVERIIMDRVPGITEVVADNATADEF